MLQMKRTKWNNECVLRFRGRARSTCVRVTSAHGVETARRLTWSAMVVGESLVYVEQVLEDPLLPGLKSSVRGEEPGGARRGRATFGSL